MLLRNVPIPPLWCIYSIGGPLPKLWQDQSFYRDSKYYIFHPLHSSCRNKVEAQVRSTSKITQHSLICHVPCNHWHHPGLAKPFSGSVEGSPAAGSVARSLQAFTAIPIKKKTWSFGVFSRPPIFFLSLPLFCLHFLSLL